MDHMVYKGAVVQVDRNYGPYCPYGSCIPEIAPKIQKFDFLSRNQHNSNGHMMHIEVRDSRTGYLVPGRDGLGAWPDEELLGSRPRRF